ncbi:MAG: UbiA family prenyltransferase [Fidelibacterota bacterium]
MKILLPYLRLIHPFTSLAVTIVTVIIAMSSDPPFDLHRVFLVGFVMLTVQFSFGVSNDVLDQRYDSEAKPWKPIPSNKVRKRGALIIFATLVACSFALCSVLGWIPLGIMLFGFCCGMAYNLGLKRTLLSWLPLSLAVPTILVWVRAINEKTPNVLFWSYPLGLLLGPALNLANQLAGAEEASYSGERSLIHFLGVVKGRRVAVGLFALVTLFMPIVVRIHDLQVEVATVGSVATFLFIAIFAVLAEFDHRLALWPLAILIASVQGVFFVLAIQ